MTTLYWSMAMNAAQFATVVVLIVVIVHYAMRAARAEGKLEIREAAVDEAHQERIRQL
jgi:hypothetical protein